MINAMNLAAMPLPSQNCKANHGHLGIKPKKRNENEHVTNQLNHGAHEHYPIVMLSIKMP